ncbi:MAG TPA: phage portal protein, partial [Parvibaculum sp.]
DTISGLFALAYGHCFIDGDAIGLPLWIPGRGRWATTLQLVDPDRLSNPNNMFDQDRLRAGVEVDQYGAATAYHFRRRHPNDIFGARAGDSMIWDRVPRQTAWGRPQVIHFFEKDRAGQSRGIGRLTPVIEALFMDHRLGRAELQAAVLNAILAVVLESPLDADMATQGLAPNSDSFGAYQAMRKDFHDEKRLTFGGVQITSLFPNEKLKMEAPSRPNANFADFESAVLRKAAAGIGTSYEQLSRDWSKTNYSSARAALIEVWRGYIARREEFTQGFCTPFFGCWLEEDISLGTYDDLVDDALESFHTLKAAWLRCRWIGPGRGWVDPTKEAEAMGLRLAFQVGTQEDESAEQGRDWQDDQDQLAREMRRRHALGLPDPVYPNKPTPMPPAGEADARPAKENA